MVWRTHCQLGKAHGTCHPDTSTSSEVCWKKVSLDISLARGHSCSIRGPWITTIIYHPRTRDPQARDSLLHLLFFRRPPTALLPTPSALIVIVGYIGADNPYRRGQQHPRQCLPQLKYNNSEKEGGKVLVVPASVFLLCYSGSFPFFFSS